MCRPAWRKMAMTFESTDTELAFKNALFQTGEPYITDQGQGSLISMQSGRVFRSSIDGTGFVIQEIPVPGAENPANLPMAWAIQAENYFIIQDGSTLPIIYNGASAVRSTENQIPVGRQMAYYMGRIWVAKGRDYLAGDIIFGPSGSPELGRRDSILYF